MCTAADDTFSAEQGGKEGKRGRGREGRGKERGTGGRDGRSTSKQWKNIHATRELGPEGEARETKGGDNIGTRREEKRVWQGDSTPLRSVRC